MRDIEAVKDLERQRSDGISRREATLDYGRAAAIGQIAEGEITHIDNEDVYVRMGSYVNGKSKRTYVVQIKIDPSPKWWDRIPFRRSEMRTRNLPRGTSRFRSVSTSSVRFEDPNIKRKELDLKKLAALIRH